MDTFSKLSENIIKGRTNWIFSERFIVKCELELDSCLNTHYTGIRKDDRIAFPSHITSVFTLLTYFLSYLV